MDCCTSCEPGRSTQSSRYPGGWTYYDLSGKESTPAQKATLLPFRDLGWQFEMDATPDFEGLIWAGGNGPLCELATAQDIYALKINGVNLGLKFTGFQDK